MPNHNAEDRYKRFRADMAAAGFIVVDVLLPGHEESTPGVPCLPLELQDVTTHATTPVQIEQLGVGFIVYPK